MTVPTATGDRPLLIVNPRAARIHDAGRRSEITAAAVAAVRARTGSDPQVEEGPPDAAAQAIDAAPDAPLVVAIGGDGTIRHVAECLAGRPTPLAVVPAGTGNVLAGALRIAGIGPAMEAIRAGSPRRIDLGEARWGSSDAVAPTGRSRFLVACGVGLDARIMAAAEHEWKRRMRFGAYVGAAVRELTRLRSSRFRIDADGTALEIDGYLALVANAGELVPGRIGPRRPIDPSDGRLELIVVGGRDPVAGLHSAARLLLATDELHDGVIRRSVRRLRIEAEPAQPVEVDGDHLPPGWLEAEILPGALTVIARPA